MVGERKNMTHTITDEDIINGFQITVDGCDIDHSVTASAIDNEVTGIYEAQQMYGCTIAELENIIFSPVADRWTQDDALAEGSPWANKDAIWQDNNGDTVHVYEFNYNSVRNMLYAGELEPTPDKITYTVQDEEFDRMFIKTRGITYIPYSIKLPACAQAGDKITATVNNITIESVVTYADIDIAIKFISVHVDEFGAALSNYEGSKIERIENSMKYVSIDGLEVDLGVLAYNIIDTTIPASSVITFDNYREYSDIASVNVGLSINSIVDGTTIAPDDLMLSSDELAISSVDITTSLMAKEFGTATIADDLGTHYVDTSFINSIVNIETDSVNEKTTVFNLTGNEFTQSQDGVYENNIVGWHIARSQQAHYSTGIVEPDSSLLGRHTPVINDAITTNDFMFPPTTEDSFLVETFQNVDDIIYLGGTGIVDDIQSSNQWVQDRLTVGIEKSRIYGAQDTFGAYGFAINGLAISKYDMQ